MTSPQPQPALSELNKLSHYVIKIDGRRIIFAIADNIPIHDPDEGLKPKDIALLSPHEFLLNQWSPYDIREAICNYILEKGFQI